MIKTVPTILQYSTRVILWGCKLDGDQLFAAIAFFNRGLTMKTIGLKSRKGEPIIKVKTPDQFYKSKHRGRSQNLWLPIVRD